MPNGYEPSNRAQAIRAPMPNRRSRPLGRRSRVPSRRLSPAAAYTSTTSITTTSMMVSNWLDTFGASVSRAMQVIDTATMNRPQPAAPREVKRPKIAGRKPRCAARAPDSPVTSIQPPSVPVALSAAAAAITGTAQAPKMAPATRAKGALDSESSCAGTMPITSTEAIRYTVPAISTPPIVAMGTSRPGFRTTPATMAPVSRPTKAQKIGASDVKARVRFEIGSGLSVFQAAPVVFQAAS